MPKDNSASTEAPAPKLSPLEILVREKIAAGLPRADAEEVAKRQLEHDAELAKSEKKS